MSTFLAICFVIILLTLPARFAVAYARRAQRRALFAELARRPRTVVVPFPVPAPPRAVRRPAADQARALHWGPSGSDGVSL